MNAFNVNNEMQFSLFNVLSDFEIALQDAIFEIVDVVAMCIEMQ